MEESQSPPPPIGHAGHGPADGTQRKSGRMSNHWFLALCSMLLLLQVVAFASSAWTSTSSGSSTGVGLFRIAGDGSTDFFCNPDVFNSCSLSRAARTFSVLSLILLIVAMVLSRREYARGIALLLAGLTGMMGWAIFYGGLQIGVFKDHSPAFITYYVLFAQTLAIVVWCCEVVISLMLLRACTCISRMCGDTQTYTVIYNPVPTNPYPPQQHTAYPSHASSHAPSHALSYQAAPQQIASPSPPPQPHEPIIIQPNHAQPSPFLAPSPASFDFSRSWQEVRNTPVDTSLVQLCATEFLGSFMYVLLCCIAHVMSGGPSIYYDLARGFVLTALLLAFFNVSDCQFNPAICLAFACMRKMSFPAAAIVMVWQLLGSMLGAVATLSVFPHDQVKEYNYGMPMLPSTFSTRQGFTMEMFLTMVLVFITLKTRGSADEFLVRSSPFAIGLAVSALSLAGSFSGGGCMNPARVLGPALVGEIWDNQWIYWIGPAVGVLLALLASVLTDKGSPSAPAAGTPAPPTPSATAPPPGAHTAVGVASGDDSPAHAAKPPLPPASGTAGPSSAPAYPAAHFSQQSQQPQLFSAAPAAATTSYTGLLSAPAHVGAAPAPFHYGTL